MLNFNELKELCGLPGISGREAAVRDWIIARLPASATYEVDPLGNLIVNKLNKRCMLCAHMDEVGLLVTDITSDGFLKFSHVGGISSAVYLGKQVLVGDRQLPGVIGVTPIHLLEENDRKAWPKPAHLVIDIGAESREEAENYLNLGDSVTFSNQFSQIGEECYHAKAIDDRIGCLILLELLREQPNLCAVFTTREEVGGAAGAAAAALQPNFALVLETTTAADLPGVSGAARVCVLGGGAVVPFMDKGTVYPFDLYQFAMALARQACIPAQTKTAIAGGNDAKSIHTSGKGVPTLAISVPCRSLHSPGVVMRQSDAVAVYELAELLWKELMAR
jgi:endoglucanase